jgi:MFS family permease
VPFIILFGIGYGGNNTMRAALVREFFGRSHFGTIHGFMMSVAILGAIAGPPLAGWVFDNRGSYQGIWFVFAGLAIAALIMVATTPPVSATIQPADKY